MFIRLLISIVLLTAFANSRPHEHAASSEQHTESIQQEVRKFYTGLNTEERAQLTKFAKTNAANFSLSNTQFMDGIKDETSGFVAKLSGLRNIINEQLASMQPESRGFIEEILRKFLAAFSQDGLMNILGAMKGLGKETLDMYDGLPKVTQIDVLKAFPTIGSFATNDIVRFIFQKGAEFDLISRSFTPAPTVDLKDDSESGPKISHRKFLPTAGPPRQQQEHHDHHQTNDDDVGDELGLDDDDHHDHGKSDQHKSDQHKQHKIATTMYPKVDGIEEPFAMKKTES